MKYQIRTISLAKMVITPGGVVTSMCDSCTTGDCPYQIEKQQVSFFGINKTMRCVMQGGMANMVISCDGYSPA